MKHIIPFLFGLILCSCSVDLGPAYQYDTLEGFIKSEFPQSEVIDQFEVANVADAFPAGDKDGWFALFDDAYSDWVHGYYIGVYQSGIIVIVATDMTQSPSNPRRVVYYLR